jgi:hypothetical protein
MFKSWYKHGALWCIELAYSWAFERTHLHLEPLRIRVTGVVDISHDNTAFITPVHVKSWYKHGALWCIELAYSWAFERTHPHLDPLRIRVTGVVDISHDSTAFTTPLYVKYWYKHGALWCIEARKPA